MTFKIDAYKGWTETALKQRCRELVHIATRNELLVTWFATKAPDLLEQMPDGMREDAKRISARYDDPDQQEGKE